jgi:hypothetical protein
METLVGAVPERAAAAHPAAPGHHPGAEQALAHLHGLERALVALAAPLRRSRLMSA